MAIWPRMEMAITCPDKVQENWKKLFLKIMAPNFGTIGQRFSHRVIILKAHASQKNMMHFSLKSNQLILRNLGRYVCCHIFKKFSLDSSNSPFTNHFR